MADNDERRDDEGQRLTVAAGEAGSSTSPTVRPRPLSALRNEHAIGETRMTAAEVIERMRAHRAGDRERSSETAHNRPDILMAPEV